MHAAYDAALYQVGRKHLVCGAHQHNAGGRNPMFTCATSGNCAICKWTPWPALYIGALTQYVRHTHTHTAQSSTAYTQPASSDWTVLLCTTLSIIAHGVNPVAPFGQSLARLQPKQIHRINNSDMHWRGPLWLGRYPHRSSNSIACMDLSHACYSL